MDLFFLKGGTIREFWDFESNLVYMMQLMTSRLVEVDLVKIDIAHRFLLSFVVFFVASASD